MKRSGKTNRAEPSDMSWVQTFDTLKFKLTRELLAKATGILDEGEYWF